MGIVLLSLGALIMILGIYFGIRSFIFMKQSKIIEGKIINRAFNEYNDYITIRFVLDQEEYERYFTICGDIKINEPIQLRVIKQEDRFVYKLNKIIYIFEDLLILCPIGLSLIIISFLFH